MKFYSIDTTGDGGSAGRVCYRGSGRGMARMWPPIVVALILATGADTSAQTKIDLKSQARSVDFSGAGSTKPSKTGTVLPSTCSPGETFLKTDATAGQNFYVCTSANVWTQQGTAIPSVTGFANMVLATDGSALMWRALGGDASGPPTSLTVSKLQGRAVSAAAPAASQALVWNATSSQWEPQNQIGGGGGGIPSVFGRTGAVMAQFGDYSFGQISGSVGDSQVATGISATKIGTGTVSNVAFGYLAHVTSDIQAQINGMGGTGTALGGDLSGSLSRANVSGIQSHAVSSEPPTNGQVLTWNLGSNQWEPQNLPNLTGSYSASFVSQTTVTIAGATHQLGTANLFVTCYDNAIPNVRVQPNTISINPTSYDVVITFTTAQSGRCVATAGGGGSGGGGGASMASQLGDFSVTWTSGALLTVGPNCSPTMPCNVRVGTNVYRFVNPATITVTGGTGTAYIYVDTNGVLTVGHNVTLTCTVPCAAVSSVTSFPLNSIPLYTWTASAGNWDASGGVDKRALLTTRVLTAGTGIVTLDTGSSTNVSVDAAVVPTYLTATATLGFGSIATGSCAADQTFTLAGAAVGDAVAAGWPSGIANGLLGIMRVSAPNTVAVRMCNLSGGTVSPASATYRGTVVRNF